MVDTNALRGLIVAKGYTMAEVAERIGMTPKTFYSKMKKRIFNGDEMDMLIELLDIQDPVKIFFAD